MTGAALSVSGLSKTFGRTTVLDSVDLEIAAGEVHALLGENGAGKSTLIKIVSGVYKPDTGTISVQGDSPSIQNPHDATEAGIATLHQELMIAPGLSVAENVFLGREVPTTVGRIRWKRLNANAKRYFDDLGQSIAVSRPVEELSPVGMTLTALARALSQDAGLLILDEPTASLTDSEATQLFAAIRRLKEQGVGILYVSHRLEEVFEIADRFTVLRNGKKVAEGLVSDTSIRQIIQAMAGRPVETVFPPKASGNSESVVLEVCGLTGRRANDINFTVAPGEVLGIAGLAGSGRSEVLRLIAGAQRRRSGTILWNGGPFDPRDVGSAQKAGVVLVPQERRHAGLLPDSVLQNLAITVLDRLTFIRWVKLSRPLMRRHADKQWDRFQIRGASVDQDVLTLSGGNQQKVVLAKFLALNPRLLLLDEPTRGVDVATKSEIYRLIQDLAEKGIAVVVVSSELSELMAMSHKVIALNEGRQVAGFDPDHSTEEQILHACYGREA